MLSHIRRAFILLPLLAILGCQGEGKPATDANYSGPASEAQTSRDVGAGVAGLMAPASPAAYEVPVKPDILNTVSADSGIASMIIRTGQAFVQVDSLEVGIGLVKQLATTVGGFIANSSIQTGQGQQRMATLEIKVPSTRYDQAIGGLSNIGKLISANTSAEDVGEEFVDVTARVANARRLEERLINLLATRTGKLDDVLSVERELARVREEIERYDGRLRYLRTKVSVSTLTVTVAEPGPVVGQPGSNIMSESFKQAWRNFVTVIAQGIQLLGGLLPILVLVSLGWVLWRRRRPRSSEVLPTD